MPEGISYTASASTFAQCDGTNFSTAGVEVSTNLGSSSLSIYTGVGSEFEKKKTGLVADLKGSIPYGKSSFSGGFRFRNNINPTSKSLQMRAMPLNYSVKLPVGQKTKFYATPYIQSKYHYESGKFDNPSVGIYSGISTQFADNTRMFVEGQLYDVTDVNRKTSSINAGVSFAF